jgi:serine/threonine protein kinase
MLGYSKEDEEFLKPKIEINYKEMKKDVFELTFDCADIDAIDLLKKMLVVNYENRITIEKILDHPFLSNEQSYKDVNLPI